MRAAGREGPRPCPDAATRSTVSRISCFSIRRDVHVGRGHVRQGRGRGETGDGLAQLLRRLRDQLQHLERLRAQVHEPRLDLGADVGRFRNVQAAGDEVRPAVQPFGDLEALRALADQVVLARGRGDIAQDIRDHTHAMQGRRRRPPAVGPLLHPLKYDDHLSLLAGGLLGGGDRGRAGDDHGQDHLRKEHQFLHRNDDEGVGGYRRQHLAGGSEASRGGIGPWRRGTGLGGRRRVGGRRLAHPPTFLNFTIRQPSRDPRSIWS